MPLLKVSVIKGLMMKTKFFTFIIKSTFFFFSFLPRRVVIILGCMFGFLLRCIGFKKKRIIANLNIVYGSKEQWPEKIIKNIYQHFGLLFTEILKQPSTSKDELNKMTNLAGLEHIDKALEKKRGIILISGHTGNWEYTMASLVIRGYDLNVVVKKLKNVDSDYLFHKLRGSKNVKTIYKEKAVLNIRRALGRNEICLLVIDQNSKKSEGLWIEHFGQLASTFTAPYILGKRFKCPVLPAFSFRGDNLRDHYAEIYAEIVPQECEDFEDEIKLNLRVYLKSFEDFLLKHPEQWIWMHRRWRSVNKVTQE